MHRSSYRLYILGLLSKHHAPHTCLRHISLCTFHCTSLRNKQFLNFYPVRNGRVEIFYSGYGHTVLQNWFFQNKFVTDVFLENTTYVRNTLHDF